MGTLVQKAYGVRSCNHTFLFLYSMIWSMTSGEAIWRGGRVVEGAWGQIFTACCPNQFLYLCERASLKTPMIPRGISHRLIGFFTKYPTKAIWATGRLFLT